MFELKIFPEGYQLKDIHAIAHWFEDNIGEGDAKIRETDLTKYTWGAKKFDRNTTQMYTYIDENEKQITTEITAVIIQIRDECDYLAAKLRWT